MPDENMIVEISCFEVWRRLSDYVDDDIEPSCFGENLLHGIVSGLLRTDIQLCGSKIDICLSGKLPSGFHLLRIASVGFTHSRVDCVPRLGQTACCQGTKST